MQPVYSLFVQAWSVSQPIERLHLATMAYQNIGILLQNGPAPQRSLHLWGPPNLHLPLSRLDVEHEPEATAPPYDTSQSYTRGVSQDLSLGKAQSNLNKLQVKDESAIKAHVTTRMARRYGLTSEE